MSCSGSRLTHRRKTNSLIYWYRPINPAAGGHAPGHFADNRVGSLAESDSRRAKDEGPRIPTAGGGGSAAWSKYGGQAGGRGLRALRMIPAS